MKKIFGRILFFALILSLAVYLNRSGALEKILGWIEGHGIWGPAIFFGVYALSCIFFVPSLIFTFSGGILFGLWKGFLLSLAGNGVGSLGAFWIGRYFAQDFVQKKMAHRKEFHVMNSALERKGWKVILLARFSPAFPFLIGNYVFGITKIKSIHYFIATIVGTIPSALVYTYLGFMTGDLAHLNQEGRAWTPQEWGLLGLGLTATLGLGWYLRRLSKEGLLSDRPAGG